MHKSIFQTLDVGSWMRIEAQKVNNLGCEGCIFSDVSCACNIPCHARYRDDNQKVIFILVEEEQR